MLTSETAQALIFDFDGTLADTMPTHYLAWKAALDRHGMAFSEVRFYELAGWSTRHLAEMLIQEFGRELSVERLALEKEAEFVRIADQIAPIQPVIDVVAKYRGQKPLAVATSGMRQIIVPILEKLQIASWFDAVVTAEDVVHAKPAPDLFLEAARRLAVEPSACLVYEDAEAGFEAARRAGMAFVDVRPLLRASEGQTSG
jgi:beta-phosphoglucomutase family hydrolase